MWLLASDRTRRRLLCPTLIVYHYPSVTLQICPTRDFNTNWFLNSNLTCSNTALRWDFNWGSCSKGSWGEKGITGSKLTFLRAIGGSPEFTGGGMGAKRNFVSHRSTMLQCASRRLVGPLKRSKKMSTSWYTTATAPAEDGTAQIVVHSNSPRSLNCALSCECFCTFPLSFDSNDHRPLIPA